MQFRSWSEEVQKKHPAAGRVGRTDAQPTDPRRGDVISSRLARLAEFSDDPDRLTRLYLGSAHKQAAEQVAEWMCEAGMDVRLDNVGSIVGRYEGVYPGQPALLIGSHIDTVRDAGKFDGTLGVLAAIEVVHKLNLEKRRLPFALEVVAFGDEEGVRYPGTLTGSRALAGRFDAKVLDEVDQDGITRRAALEAFGCNPSAIGDEARSPKDVLGYIEMHIEQGPVLDAENLPVAVVTAISGASRGLVTVVGPGGHAGTVPMSRRNDASSAASEMVLAVERLAKETPDLVGTVGQFTVKNGAVNIIPATVVFSIDVRSPSDEIRKRALQMLQRDFVAIARRRGVEVTVEIKYDAAAASCDPWLSDTLASAIERSGRPVRTLPSGAGHDGMAFKDKFPFAMLFVRCRGGISHHPDEFADTEDIDLAAEILADCVLNFSPKR